MPVNLTYVSPSTVGAYAACSQRLVFDTKYGKPFIASPNMDFGTVCHYTTHHKLGLGTSAKELAEAVIANAANLPEFNKDVSYMTKAASKCADKAIAALPKLPLGVRWLAEVSEYSKQYLPSRISRKGLPGFGGDIDLLSSDRKQLWDFKFVSRPVEKIKVEYLWQLASYHILSGAPKTGMLFITRDAKFCGIALIDWSLEKHAPFINNVANFLHSVDDPKFSERSYPVEGEHCAFCEHKHVCPLKSVPEVKQRIDFDIDTLPIVDGGSQWLEKLAGLKVQTPSLF
jgi:hypothetical protein